MKLREIVGIVGGIVITKQAKPDLEISSCGASALMSDVLSFMKPGSLLLTGLIHPQSVRTAEMADLAAIVFVRGKKPGPEVVDLANDVADAVRQRKAQESWSLRERIEEDIKARDGKIDRARPDQLYKDLLTTKVISPIEITARQFATRYERYTLGSHNSARHEKLISANVDTRVALMELYRNEIRPRTSSWSSSARPMQRGSSNAGTGERK